MPPAESAASPPAGRAVAAGILLCLLVIGLFLPATRNAFVNLDDPSYVTANWHVHGGLSWAGVEWAFRSGRAANWHPLTWLSHMLDCQLFGLKPWGHHLTSVLLHGLNTLLVFLLLLRMTGAFGRSLFVAALFGFHPLRVESVAWVAERKDVLSTLFGLLSLWAYLRWVEESGRPKSQARLFRGLALLCFVLALMSKPMLVTLPAVFLLLDYWPLRRLRPLPGLPPGRIVLRLLGEKIAFFAAAAAASVVTFVVQRSAGAVETLDRLPLGFRVENALISYCRYLDKLFDPTRLAVFYPYPDFWPAVDVLLAGVLVAGASFLVIMRRRQQPYLLVGWFWYLGTLLPVIGLVQVGVQSMADRYTYLPSIGIFLLLTWGACELTAGWHHRKVALGAAAAAALLGCAGLAHRQIGYWADSEILFQHALSVTKKNWPMHAALGNVLAKRRDSLSEAIAEYKTALKINPDDAEAHSNLGNALANFPDRLPEELTEYQAALKLDPGYAEAHNSFGIALAKLPGGLSEAIAEFEFALQINPDYADAHNNLGNALKELPGRLPEAIAEFEAAVRLNPENGDTHFNLGNALANLPGRLPEAIAQYEAVLRIAPGDVQAQYNLGAALAALPGRQPEAIAHFEAALRIKPDFEPARQALDRLDAAGAARR